MCFMLKALVYVFYAKGVQPWLLPTPIYFAGKEKLTIR